MSTIFVFFVILISSDGILGLSRKVRTTQEDSTSHLTTDRNAVADYISQKIKGIEQATELSVNPNFSPGSASILGPGISFGAPRGKQQMETGSISPGQYSNEGSNPVIPAGNPSIVNINQKPVKDNSAPKRLNNNLKTSENSHQGLFESSSEKPDGYAMRISAESIEIDATIGDSNNTGDVNRGNWSNLSDGDGENGYSDLSRHGSEGEKMTQTTQGPGMENENMSGESATTLDPIDEEIKQVLDALPKLPELGFSDNDTHFVFHKDPEEAALDDRITQVARQLAETSLRRRYEEQKLGHYIPIRLRHFDDEYQSNAYTPARKLNTGKAYGNALDILRQIQQPQVKFRALSIPQHIYNTPLYRSKDQSLQAPAKVGLSNSPGPVYVTENDGQTRMAMAPIFNPNTFGAIVQFGPRYVLPIPKVSLDQNRIPLFFGLTQPKPVQPFHNHNDLNTYPYREMA